MGALPFEMCTFSSSGYFLYSPQVFSVTYFDLYDDKNDQKAINFTWDDFFFHLQAAQPIAANVK